VFKRDVAMQKLMNSQNVKDKDPKLTDRHHVEKEFAKKNKKITENIQNWLNQIEMNGRF